MIFLIEYDRPNGRLVTFREYDDLRRREAEDARFDLELDLYRKGLDHEVVILEAPSKEALRRTHRRYFADLRELLQSFIDEIARVDSDHI